MSLESWRAEFYPIEADEVTEDDALDHSIQKWTGLLPENLAKHGVQTLLSGIDHGVRAVCDQESPFIRLSISSSSCALCFHFDGGHNRCEGCPLYQVRDGVRCDHPIFEREDESPFEAFSVGNYPNPMLVQLRRAKDMKEKE